MDEFDKWAIGQGLLSGEAAWALAKITWTESASRADRKAREECAEIVKSAMKENKLAFPSIDAHNLSLILAEQAIRATIPEEP